MNQMKSRTICFWALAGLFGMSVTPVAGQAQNASEENSRLETIVTLPSSGPTENLCQTADGTIYITGLEDQVLWRVSPDRRLDRFASFPEHTAIVGVAAGDNEFVLTVFRKPYRRPVPAGSGA